MIDQHNQQPNNTELSHLFDYAENADKLLDFAYKTLGNPLVVHDLSYNLIKNTENTVNDDPLWNELITNGVFSHETFSFFGKEKFIEAYNNSEVVSLMTSPLLKYDRACCKLFNSSGIQIGDMTVVACYRPFNDMDFYNMEIIGELISKLLEDNELDGKTATPDSLINKLIYDGSKTNIDKNELVSLRASLKKNLYIAVIDVSNYEPTLTHLVYLSNLLEKIQDEYKYYVGLNNIISIISTDEIALNIKRDLAGLNDFFKNNSIFAGISSVFKNLSEIRTYYKQALNALNYGMSSHCNLKIFMFDNYRLDYFLNSIRNDTDIMELCIPLITSIRERDKKSGSSLYNILRSVCECSGNKANALSQLGIDDLNKQIDTLANEFGIDINNLDICDATKICFSIKATECCLRMAYD